MTANLFQEIFAYCEECDWESEHLPSDEWGLIETQAYEHNKEYHNGEMPEATG